MKNGLQEEQLKALPTKPGVYLLKDGEGNILYVGKAANLRHRVRSYFASWNKLTPKLQRVVAQVADFEFLVTTSEQEAILLECTLIKKHRPRYNVALKDDKSFPYLKISLNEEFPQVYPTRRLEKDGSRYFGPFASSWSLRQTLRLLNKLFLFRSCRKSLTRADPRACLEYHLHRCIAPCRGTVRREEYCQIIDQIILFLEGKQEIILADLHHKMEEAAQEMEFEKAAYWRDQIRAVEKVIERQKIASAEGEEDVIALARSKDQAYAQVFFIRNGKLLGQEHFILVGTQDEEPGQIMTSFVQQFYSVAPYIPPLILLQYPVQKRPVIEKWMAERKGDKVILRKPCSPAEKELVELVAENARQGLEQLRVRLLTEPEMVKGALEELRQQLHLPRQPERIECYDVSDIRGISAVGSMIVFEKGHPKPAHYRRFRIKTIAAANDYAMLQEVLRRRFRRKNAPDADGSWALLPDLVLIDGGKGQLNAALEVMGEFGEESVPVASIAKQEEEIFLPGAPSPLLLSRSSPALFLLQRIRDEAHRFALGYYRKVHRKEALTSVLDAIPGVGAKRKKALLQKFGSIKGIKEASEKELAAVPGIPSPLAQKIKEYL